MPGLQIFKYMYILLYVSDSQALGISYIVHAKIITTVNQLSLENVGQLLHNCCMACYNFFIFYFKL